jgi:CMP-N-acetylneuraminic acid synthetase
MKGHSARVPGKNLRSFAGAPLLARIIRTLLDCSLVDRIVIDTDDAQIAEASREAGAHQVIDRPRALCGDDVSVNRLIAHDVSLTDGDVYLQTHATNPLLRSDTIDRALSDFLADTEADSLFSVTRSQKRFYSQDGRALNHNPSELIPTQDLEPWFEENSCIYAFTRSSLERTGARIGASPLMFEMDALEAIDIDTPQEFIIAESVFRTMYPHLVTG